MDFLAWLASTPIADAIRTSIWLYPALETGHYVGLALLVGSIMLIDLRLLGFPKSLPLDAMLGLLPWVWVGFVINLFTGSMMFIYGAESFGPNGAFQLKMTFMLLAGINALIFTVAASRSREAWVANGRVPLPIKSIATLSFALWLCVMTTGRWMAYI